MLNRKQNEPVNIYFITNNSFIHLDLTDKWRWKKKNDKVVTVDDVMDKDQRTSRTTTVMQLWIM